MRTVQGLVVAGLLLGAGCATPSHTTEIPLKASRVMPASQGMARATEGPGGNTTLTVQVKHVAPPSRIATDAEVYVVWVVPPYGPPQNVGVLTVNRDLEGTLNTVTPHKKFRVLITPESDRDVVKPSHDEVFKSQVETLPVS